MTDVSLISYLPWQPGPHPPAALAGGRVDRKSADAPDFDLERAARVALEIEGLARLLGAEAAARRGALPVERRAFRERLESSLGTGQGTWLHAIDELQAGT